MDNFLITWFYAEKKDDESFYPSVGGNTSSPAYQKVYWKCVYDFYRSAQLTQIEKSVKYLFFTNVPNIPTDIDGFNLSNFFCEMGVHVERLELSNRTPKDWYGAWRNQFYLFDVLQYLKAHYEGNFLVLDSDIFVTKDLLPVFKDIQQNHLISYDCGYDEKRLINGISIGQMQDLYLKYAGGNTCNLRYKGGEFIGINSDVLSDVLKCYFDLWKFNYGLYEKKQVKLNEEAHFLSLIYYHLGYKDSIANKYIKRMWTTVRCDNICSGDENLPLWHLPAEKKYLFQEMSILLQKCTTMNMYIHNLRKHSHIPGWRVVRILNKFAVKIKEKTYGN